MKHARTLSLLLMSVVFAALGAVIVLLVQNRALPPPPAGENPLAELGADISMTSVFQTSVKDGRTERTLAAETAYLVEQENKVAFEKIVLTFFSKDGTPAIVTADRAMLYTDTSDADLSGSVMIENQGHRICTEALHYEDNRHILYSNTPVAVIGESIYFTADAMTFDLATGRAVLSGNVNGNITDTSRAVR